MFFQNIEKWTKKLLITVTVLCYIAYFGLVVLAPTIVVLTKYQVFQNGTHYVTGFGIIVFVVVGIVSYIFMKKVISKLPKTSINQQRFRFGLETLFDCLPLGIALFALFAVKDDIDLAFQTFKVCLFLFLGGVLWNGLFIKFLDAEWDIRSATLLDKEKAKRKDVV